MNVCAENKQGMGFRDLLFSKSSWEIDFGLQIPLKGDGSTKLLEAHNADERFEHPCCNARWPDCIALKACSTPC